LLDLGLVADVRGHNGDVLGLQGGSVIVHVMCGVGLCDRCECDRQRPGGGTDSDDEPHVLTSLSRDHPVRPTD
jgi:hypothetical protein